MPLGASYTREPYSRSSHRLETEAHLPLTVTATSLLTEITRFLLTLGRYLDLLDEGGFAPRPASACDKAGIAKICPG